MTPSHYQTKIFSFVQQEKSNLSITAVAGSGKTTTILEASKQAPSSLFLAYNKSIAETLSSKGVNAKTLHSLGYSALARKGLRVNDRKMGNILRYKVMQLDEDADRDSLVPFYDCVSYFSKMASLLKGQGIFHPEGITEPLLQSLSEHYLLDREANDLYTLKEMFKWSRQGKTIDFDDMLEADGGLTVWPTVFVDEAQDLNKAQQDFIEKIARRVILVGDPAQAIYGFRGAGQGGMSSISSYFHCKQLPLSICYRCSRAVVDYARRIQPQIECAPGAIEGEVSSVSETQLPFLVKPGDVILCRTNAPLVGVFFRLLRDGVPSHILGKDILKEMEPTIRYVYSVWGFTPVGIQEWFNEEYGKLKEKGKKYEITRLIDKKDILDTFALWAQGKHPLEECSRMFNAEGGVTLSTIHKMKGKEAENVYLLRPDLLPHPSASAIWELEQEDNLRYVAITRARKGFYNVEA